MPDKINIDEAIIMLNEISDCIDYAVENDIEESKISDIVELMKDIVEENWMYIRN